MRISDWSSDVCSSDLDLIELRRTLESNPGIILADTAEQRARAAIDLARADKRPDFGVNVSLGRRNPDFGNVVSVMGSVTLPIFAGRRQEPRIAAAEAQAAAALAERADALRELEAQFAADLAARSEEHTSELQSQMRISYAVIWL